MRIESYADCWNAPCIEVYEDAIVEVSDQALDVGVR